MAKASTKMQVNTWEQDMAKSAVVAGKSEAKLVERPFFSTGSGQLKLQGAILPNAEAPVIILDQIHANLYYSSAYNPNAPESPDCYAYGRVNDDGEVVGVDTWDGRTEMAPHKDSANREHTDCATCPMNQFGSAKMGAGKACQNTRRLGVIPAGTMKSGKFEPFAKPEQIENGSVAYIKVPATSAKTFSKFVKDTAEALSRPTWGVFALFKVIPNAGKALPSHVQSFEQLGTIPNALMGAVHERFKQVSADLAFPFTAKTATPPEASAKGKPAPKRKYT